MTPAKARFLLLVFAAVAATGVARDVPAVIVFGDSSVDAGNNNAISTLLKSNFRPYGRDFYGGVPTGRFSNGKIPPDLISEAFGLRPFVPAYLDPAYNISDFAHGVCFASAGTGFDNATSSVLNVIPLWKQVEYFKEYAAKLKGYLGEEKAAGVITRALYVVSLGTNDFLENYYSLPTTRGKYTIQQYQDYIVGLAENFVKTVYALGSRKMSFTGLPPMGCLPLERTTNFLAGVGEGCNEAYNKVALEFNVKLGAMVKKLNAQLPGARIVFSNPYYIFKSIIRKPAAYGLEVTSVACCSTGLFEMGYLCSELNPLTCSDASKYAFWDSFHPTETTSRIIVDHLLKTTLREFLL